MRAEHGSNEPVRSRSPGIGVTLRSYQCFQLDPLWRLPGSASEKGLAHPVASFGLSNICFNLS